MGVETKPGLGAPANPVSVDPADPADPADPPQPTRSGRRVPRPALSELVGLVGLVLVLVAMALVLVNNIEDHPQLSYLDEVGNADYLFQASHGGMAQLGERLGPEITKETACRGIQLQPPMDVPCPGDGDPAKVPGWDVTNTDIHPPTYYYATFGISKAILTVAPTDSLVTAGRLANIVWLGLGLVLVYLLLRDLRVNVPARLAVCLLIALCPSVVQHMSIVNVTATVIPAGALLVLATVRWEQRRWPLVALAGAAALGVALKADNLVPVFAICVYLLARAFVLLRAGTPAPASVVTRPPRASLDVPRPLGGREVPPAPERPEDAWPRVGRSGDWRRYAVAALVTAVAALAVEATWLAIRNAVAIGGPWDNPGSAIFRRSSIHLDDVLSQVTALALPLGAVHPSAPLISLTGLLLVGACAGAMLHRRSDDPLQSWGLAVTAAAVLGGPLLVVGTYLGSSIIFPLPGRYGFGLVVPMAMLLGVALRSRVAAVMLLAAVAALAAVGGVVPPTRTDMPQPARTSAPASHLTLDRTVITTR